ncbi:hypothetical protein [Stenotrophomonas nitritireducens]|uniref:hypothetical protein n=1 Tax=Stenotrophomonas nitritireducens TaxID=83617 RepID=UPI003D998C7E
MTDPSPHLRWQTAVHAHARHFNDYIARGDARDWEGMGDPDDAPDLSPLLPSLMEQLRAANAGRDADALARFREQWPPLHEALQPLLEDNGQGIGALADGGRRIAGADRGTSRAGCWRCAAWRCTPCRPCICSAPARTGNWSPWPSAATSRSGAATNLPRWRGCRFHAAMKRFLPCWRRWPRTSR